MMTQEMMMLGDQGRTNKQRGHQGKGKASNIIKCLTLHQQSSLVLNYSIILRILANIILRIFANQGH